MEPPAFTTNCNIFTGVAGNLGPLRLTVDCQLLPAFSYRRVNDMFIMIPPWSSIVVVPALTDVRDDAVYSVGNFTIGPNADYIECPAGSGTFFRAGFVLDSFKGSPMEYRSVFCPRFSRATPML